jgi:hypothetical protein
MSRIRKRSHGDSCANDNHQWAKGAFWSKDTRKPHCIWCSIDQGEYLEIKQTQLAERWRKFVNTVDSELGEI